MSAYPDLMSLQESELLFQVRFDNSKTYLGRDWLNEIYQVSSIDSGGLVISFRPRKSCLTVSRYLIYLDGFTEVGSTRYRKWIVAGRYAVRGSGSAVSDEM